MEEHLLPKEGKDAARDTPEKGVSRECRGSIGNERFC
jgi:hypothetical protein